MTGQKINYKNLVNKTILLVCTENMVSSLMREILACTKSILIVETDWLNAVVLCGADSTIDLVVIDIEPYNTNGLETLQTVLALGSELPVIGLLDIDERLNIRHDRLRYLFKPIFMREFLLLAENAISGKFNR